MILLGLDAFPFSLSDYLRTSPLEFGRVTEHLAGCAILVCNREHVR